FQLKDLSWLDPRHKGEDDGEFGNRLNFPRPPASLDHTFASNLFKKAAQVSGRTGFYVKIALAAAAGSA
ncbi:hypothetical protein, partial [Rhizobium sp. Root483D2]|uniref:hypothetical protein n=1 Tax=Rhizobium sp. Root483D2 TaxID=1736545 RepID=UPI001AECE310